MILVGPELSNALKDRNGPHIAWALLWVFSFIAIHLGFTFAIVGGSDIETLLPSARHHSLVSIIRANFLHAGWLHLLGNMVALFFVAKSLLSYVRTSVVLVVFLITGFMGFEAELLTLQMRGLSEMKLLGASAGLFGLLGFYSVCNFKFRSVYAYWNIVWFRTVKLPTGIFFLWDTIVLQMLFILTGMSAISNVAFVAHFVGFVVGVNLAVAYRYWVAWPEWIQTRFELLVWKRLSPQMKDPNAPAFVEGLKLIVKENNYNSIAKTKLIESVLGEDLFIVDGERYQLLLDLCTPTLVREELELVAGVIEAGVPEHWEKIAAWAAKLPFDLLLLLSERIYESGDGKLTSVTLLTLYGTSPLTFPPHAHRALLLRDELNKISSI